MRDEILLYVTGLMVAYRYEQNFTHLVYPESLLDISEPERAL